MHCEYCGTEIAENEDFCKKCVESYKVNEKPKIVINQAMPKGWKSKPKFVRQISASTLPKRQSTSPKRQSTSQKLITRLIGFVVAGFIFGILMYVVQAFR